MTSITMGSFDEICETLHKLVGNTSSLKEMEKMANQMIIEMNKGEDHEISFKDFCESFAGVEINDYILLIMINVYI